MNTTHPLQNTSKNCQVEWQIPNKVLQFSINGMYTPEQAALYNDCLTDILDKATAPITVMIDCSTMQRPTNFEVIRQESDFMNHPMLGHLYIASTDRLVRFAMMVIFNGAVANVRVFDSLSQAQIMMDTRTFKRVQT